MVLRGLSLQSSPEFWQFGIGLLLVLAVLFARRGLLGLIEDLGAAVRGHRSHDRPRWRSAGCTGASARSRVTRDVDLTLERGARQALIGPNGAGKTTLVNLITGVLQPSAGHVLLEGEDITRLSQAKRARRGIARTFQINQLFRGLTVLENVYLAIAERTGAWQQAVARRPAPSAP